MDNCEKVKQKSIFIEALSGKNRQGFFYVHLLINN